MGGICGFDTRDVNCEELRVLGSVFDRMTERASERAPPERNMVPIDYVEVQGDSN